MAGKSQREGRIDQLGNICGITCSIAASFFYAPLNVCLSWPSE